MTESECGQLRGERGREGQVGQGESGGEKEQGRQEEEAAEEGRGALVGSEGEQVEPVMQVVH